MSASGMMVDKTEDLVKVFSKWKVMSDKHFSSLKSGSFWTYLKEFLSRDSTATAIIAISWLLIGTLFYAIVDFHGDYEKGFYMSANVGYCIGWGTLPETKVSSMAFSLCFQLIGTWIVKDGLVFLIESSNLSNEEWYSNARKHKRLREEYRYATFRRKFEIIIEKSPFSFYMLIILIIYLIFGTIWTVLAVNWTYVDGFYFSLSSLATSGVHGLPRGTPDWALTIAGLYVATGSPIMGIVMGSIATTMVASAREKRAEEVILSKFTSVEEDTFKDLEFIDDDGYLGREEYLLLTLLRLKVIDLGLIRQISERFDELDYNSSGAISFDELLNAQSRKVRRMSVIGEYVMNNDPPLPTDTVYSPLNIE